MSAPLNVLLVEDSADDAEFILRALRRGGYEPDWQRVETAADLAAALAARRWDVVLCDYVMPRFSGPAALRQTQAFDPDLPVILVSGEVSQSAAVEAMRAGARDYVMKGDLLRLAPVVEREIAEAQRRRRDQEATAESEVRLRELVGDLDGVLWEADPATLRFLFVSERAESLLGYPLAEWRASPTFWADRLHPDDLASAIAAVRQVADGGGERQLEHRLIAADGRPVWVRHSLRAVRHAAGHVTRLRGLTIDITARRAAEVAMRRRLDGERQVAAVLMQLAAALPEEVDACIVTALRTIATLARARRGYVFLVTETGNEARLRHAWTADGEQGFGECLTRAAAAPWWWASLRAARPIVLGRDDLPPEAGAERAMLERHGVDAIAAVPLSDGGTMRGFLGLSAEGEMYLAADDLIAMLRVVGEVILSAIDRAGAALALRESERRYRDLIENLSEVIYTADTAGRITYISPNVELYSGYRPEEVVGRPITDFIHPDDRAALLANYRRGLAGAPEPGEFRVLRRSGDVRWVRSSRRPIHRDGVVVGMQATLIDVTDLKRGAEERQLLELLTAQVPVGIALTDAAGQVTGLNPVALAILGSPSEEASRALNVLDLPALRDAGVDHLFRAALERGERGAKEARYRSHWGRETCVSLQVAPLFDGERVRGCVAVIEDATARIEAEERLRESEQRLRALIDGMGPSILVGLSTPDGRMLEANRSALELTGLRIEQVRGLHIADVPAFAHSEAMRSQLRASIERAAAGLTSRFEGSVSGHPSGERVIQFHVQPLRDADGEVAYIIGTGVDVTDRVGDRS
ncbi:PAS domain S-box protein [bacterium]|nr:PAS domain S-box protein [bacterium]